MVNVGDITVGVDIDGGDLGAKIGAAVREKLAPVIAEIQREINATNTGLGTFNTSGLDKVKAAADKAATSTSSLGKSTDTVTAAQARAETQARALAAARDAERIKADALTKAQDAYNAKLSQWGGKAQFATVEHQKLVKAQNDYTRALETTEARFRQSAKAEHDIGVAKIFDDAARARSAEQTATRVEQAAAREARAAEQAAARETKAVEDGIRRQTKSRNDFERDIGKVTSNIGSSLAGAALPFGGIGTAVFAGIGELPALTTAAVAGVASLTGALVQLSGAAVALPGVIGGLGSTFGVALIGIEPVANAIKDVVKAAGDNATKGQIKKAASDLKSLGDNGKSAVASLVGVYQSFKDLQKSDTETLFAGIGDKIQHAADTQLPSLKNGVTAIATALNHDLGTVLDTLSGPGTTGFLDRLLGNTAQADEKFNRAIEPIINGIEHLVGAGSDVLPRLADDFADLATKAANFLEKADKDGSLERFINNGITGVGQLGDSFINVGKILGDINQALNGGGTGGLLKSLDDGTKHLHEFLSSTEGQQKLKDFFKEGREDLDKIGTIARQLPGILSGIFNGAKEAADIFLPTLNAILEVINALPGGASTVVGAFLAWRGITAAADLVSGFQVLRDLLTKGIPADAAKAKAALAEVKLAEDATGGGGGLLPGGGGKTAAEIKAAKAAEDAANESKLLVRGSAAVTATSAAASIADFGGVAALVAPAAAVAALALGTVTASNILKDESNKHPQAFGINPEPTARRPGRESQGAPGVESTPAARAAADRQALERRAAEPLPPGALPVSAIEGVHGDGSKGIAAADKVLAAKSAVDQLSQAIKSIPPAKVDVKDNTALTIASLGKVSDAAKHLSGGNLVVTVQYRDPLGYVTSGGIGHGVGLTAIAPQGHATGGAIYGGIPGVDSVLGLLQQGEHVLDTTDVGLMGGQAGVYRFRSALNAGMLRGFDDGGAVGALGPLGPLGSGGPGITELITAVNQVRDAVLATGPNASQAAMTAVPSSAIDTSGVGTPNVPIKGTKAAPLTAEDKQANKNLTTALKPLTTEINDAIKKGLETQPGTPLDDQLIAARQSALDRNSALIAASGPAGSTQQNEFIQKNILGPLAAALNNTAKNDTPAKSLAKVGLSPDDPLVAAVLAQRGGFVAGGATPLPGTTPLPGATPLPVGSTAVGADGQPVDKNGVPLSDIGTRMLNGAIQALGGTVSQQAGNVIGAVNQSTNFPLPPSVQTAPNATVQQLLQEQNPAVLAAALGLNVPDLSRNGGTPASQDLQNTGPGFDASGRVRSNTASLTDRTATDAFAEQTAKLKQIEDVLNQVKDQLSEKVLEPIVESAVSAAFNSISDEVTNKLGTQIGQTAAPIIAQAVKGAIPANSGGDASTTSAHGLESGITGIAGSLLGGGTLFHSPEGVLGGGSVGGVRGGIGALFDEGGLWESGTIGANLSGARERVLSPTQTAAFDAGELGGWALQPQQQHMAAVQGQSANATVGADFFGASQVPIIGAIINFLIQTLLSVIGVTITARDSLDNMSKEVRGFRGDFQKFDASGRLTNDTSGLLDRSNTSKQEVVDERTRILQQVIQGVVKYIIEQIITPITKAVANAAISAGAAAAGGGIDSVAPGAGGIVSSLISSAGSAGVDVGIQVGSDAAESGIATLISSIFGIGSSSGITGSLFGGDLLDNLFSGTGLFGGLTGAFTSLIGSIFGGLSLGGLLGGITSFDDGGIAEGIGLMPKATIKPERVLSPSVTPIFDRFVDAMMAGNSSSTSSVSVHAPINVVGGASSPTAIRNHLLELMTAP